MHHISKGIADVFGEIYKKLYEDKGKDESEQALGEDENNSSTDVHNNNTEETTRIPEITTKELQTAINKLKKGKSPDNKGIRAEDIKDCDEETREVMRQIFNEIIERKEFTPEDWKKVTIKVIHKKGDVENVSNYRPICSLPALYKLFSILYGRLYPVLDQTQAEDQAGFRKSYQATDHLATYRLIGTENAMSGNQNVDSDRWTSRRRPTPSLTNQFGRPSNLATSTTNTSAS